MSDEGSASPGQTEQDEQGGGRLAEVLAARRDKLERLRARGIDPFALRFDPDTSLEQIRREFHGIEPGASTGQRVGVAGRIVLLRRHGRLSFATIRDRTGDLQLFLSEDALGDGYPLIDDLDLGDIVGARGEVVKTRKGELSVKADELELLTKALRPLPEKWHGLRDPEARFRQRYLEFATSHEARHVIWARAKALYALRGVLADRGFVEVETPVLQATHGGALARPFLTHHLALDVDLSLRIAPELYLKRLLVAGLERVFEIGRNFRNEGIDWEHNPEFTMLEAYQAYGTYEDMMDLDEALVKAAATAVRGSLTFDYKARELDLSTPWRRVPILELVSEVVGEEVTLAREDLAALAERKDVKVDPSWGAGKIVLELYEKL